MADKVKDKKRQAQEDAEYLRMVDLPEHQGGGAKFVKDYEDEKKRKEKKEVDSVKNSIFEKGIGTYLTRLAKHGNSLLDDVDFEKGWEAEFVPTSGSPINIYGKSFKTKQGIVCILKAPTGEVYVRAVRVNFDPDVDMSNVHKLSIQAENTLDSYKGLLLSDKKKEKKTKDGIYLP